MQKGILEISGVLLFLYSNENEMYFEVDSLIINPGGKLIIGTEDSPYVGNL